jgi:HD-like signal output (HDOD) protein
MAYVPIIDQIDKLPPLPESVQRLEILFSQGSYPDINKVVDVIEKDPSLTTNILACANSPLYSFSKQIVSVLQATTLFGAVTIRAMVLKSAMERTFDVDMSAYGITNAAFAKVCAMQSALMFQWYMGVNVEKVKLLVPMAFLMEIGAILISKNIIENGETDAFVQDLHNYKAISTAENLHVNMSTAQVNALLFEHWHFEPIFVACMQAMEQDATSSSEVQELTRALKAVRTVVNLKEQFAPNALERAVKLLEAHNLESQKFLAVVKRVENKFNSL